MAVSRWWRRSALSTLGLWVSVSLAFHALLYLVLVGFFGAGGEPLLEFKLPQAVEFGLVDGDGEPAPSPAPPPAPPQPIEAHQKARQTPIEPVTDLAVTDDPRDDAIVVDAGVPDPDAGLAPSQGQAIDAGTDTHTREGPEVAALSGTGFTPGATGDGLGVGAGGHGLGGFAPPGASIGLHVDVGRVKRSSLLLETEALLGVIPKWQAVLSGSGLSPLDDFTRLYVATPNLRPSHIVVAGKLRNGEKAAESAIARLARERGKTATLTRVGALERAPWWSRGPTARSISVSPTGEVVITRTPDMARVLAVARALEQRRARGELSGTDGAPEALLAMYRDEAIAFSVEGARRFVVGDPPGMPKHVRISVRPIDEFYAGLRLLGAYESPEAASAAQAYAEQLRDKLVDHPRVIYLGLKSALQKASLTREDRFLLLDARITLHQTRYLLQYLTRLLEQGERE